MKITRCSGSSLAELVITLSIISLIAGLGALASPSLMDVNARLELEKLGARISACRTSGRLENSVKEINFFLKDSQSCECVEKDGLCEKRELRDWPSYFQLSANFGGAKPETLTIYPSGVLSPGSVSLKNQRLKCSLYLGLRGSKRIDCEEVSS